MGSASPFGKCQFAHEVITKPTLLPGPSRGLEELMAKISLILAWNTSFSGIIGQPVKAHSNPVLASTQPMYRLQASTPSRRRPVPFHPDTNNGYYGVTSVVHLHTTPIGDWGSV